MQFLQDLFANKAFISGILGWFIAQVSKTVIHALVHKKIVWERMIGGGGMPSSHSATVCGLATATGMMYGGGSIEFAIALCLAIIVMYDAMNVRLETGKQGKVINDIIETFQTMGKNITPEDRMKELVGHTPMQVLIGAILGVCIAVVVVNYF